MAESKECTLGPWTLNLVSVGDSITHAVAETTYPYKNGADLEDMGVNAEVFRFSCIIVGADYTANYAEIRTWFLSTFSAPVELYHPEHGLLKGYPQNVSFANDKRKNCATFEFEFKVAGLQPEQLAYADPQYVCNAEAEAVNVAVVSAIAEDMQKAGLPDISYSKYSLGAILDAFFDTWEMLADTAREYAELMQDVAGKVQGIIESVTATVDAISSTIDYVTTLSGAITKTLQRCCDSFVALSRRLKGKSSSAAVTALATDLAEMMTTLAGTPAATAFATLAASTLAAETARHIAEDVDSMRESVAAERVQTDDALGRELATPSTPFITTPDDLEGALATTREFIQSILSTSPASDHLKKMAAVLAESVLRAKMEVLTTRTISVPEATPIHKIALDNGLSYKSAERLCALNNVKNPTFVQGEVKVYAE